MPLNNTASSGNLIVVPVYNGGRYITDFVQRVPTELRSNLLFINDGSRDDTARILADSAVQFVSHKTNRGKGAAIATGIEYARVNGYRRVVIIDVDLQHPPEQLAEFIDDTGAGFICAYRIGRRGMPLHRQVSNFLTSLFITARTGVVIKDSQCGYRSFPVDLPFLQRMSTGGYQFESEILMRAAVCGIPVRHTKIPTIYADEPSQMNNFRDTFRFIFLWFRSFYW